MSIKILCLFLSGLVMGFFSILFFFLPFAIELYVVCVCVSVCVCVYTAKALTLYQIYALQTFSHII